MCKRGLMMRPLHGARKGYLLHCLYFLFIVRHRTGVRRRAPDHGESFYVIDLWRRKMFGSLKQKSPDEKLTRA